MRMMRVGSHVPGKNLPTADVLSRAPVSAAYVQTAILNIRSNYIYLIRTETKPANWSRFTAQKAITKLLDHTKPFYLVWNELSA